jgi:hypothetical protein
VAVVTPDPRACAVWITAYSDSGFLLPLPSLGPSTLACGVGVCTSVLLPLHPSSGCLLRGQGEQAYPEPRRPCNYISRCKQAGGSRDSVSLGAGDRASSAPRESVSFPPSSLHQPFAALCHHRVGPGAGPAAAGRLEWGWGNEASSLEPKSCQSRCQSAPWQP